jgi:Tol biopolymer transport system component
VYTPSPGPGDREVVYLSDAGGHGNLWIANAQTGEARQVTNDRDPTSGVGVSVWSPDGRYIAYVDRKPGTWNVDQWIIRADGSDARRVGTDSGWATWTWDGSGLYHAIRLHGLANWRLFKYSVADGQNRVIREDGAHAPAPSPDGQTLYFLKTITGVNGVSDIEIRYARPETSPGSQLLVRLPGTRFPEWQYVHPVMSPDGKWLVLPMNDGPTTNIWIISTSSGELRQITDFAPRRTFIARRVSWSSDGRYIFAAVAEGDEDIVLLDHLPLLP